MNKEEYIEELKDLQKQAKKEGHIQVSFDLLKEIRKATISSNCIICMSAAHKRLDCIEGR